MFCMPELARILKQQSYPNGAPCHMLFLGGIYQEYTTFEPSKLFVCNGHSL